jgi:hypothetical protein
MHGKGSVVGHSPRLSARRRRRLDSAISFHVTRAPTRCGFPSGLFLSLGHLQPRYPARSACARAWRELIRRS